MKVYAFVVLLAFGISAHAKSKVESVKLLITEKGFEPSEFKFKPGTHAVLKVTRNTDNTCATQIQFKELKIKKDLPLNQEVSIDVGILDKGDIRFACGMDMISGHIVTE
jgi:plastocyanin domain-containing protein